jgi:hypothetical protein
MVVAAANSDDEDDDIFESAKANIANDWLIKITKDVKLRDLYCQQKKLSAKGMQLITQGNSAEGHPMIVEMQSIDKRILKDYKIDTLKLSNAVIEAHRSKDRASLKIQTLNSKVLASCNS